MTREQTAIAPDRYQSTPHGARAETYQKSWLLCRAGGVLCALPIAEVSEIMRLLPIEPIAGAPKYVCGLSIIRGAPVPVVDLGLVVGGRTTDSARLITVKMASRAVALAVESVLGITTISVDMLGQLPPLLRDAATDTIAAIGALDSELIVFLRGLLLVPEDVLARLDARAAAP